MNKKDVTRNTYDQNAAAFAERFNKIGGSRIQDIQDICSMSGKKNPKVLEIGCGNGRDAKKILEYTDDYIGTDISAGMIALAQADLPNAHFEVADMETFEFPANLDIVFAFAALLHLDKDAFRSILQKAHSSLNPGGLFYMTLKKDDYHEELTNDQFGQRFFYFYDNADIRELAAETGFEIIIEKELVLHDICWLVVTLRKDSISI